jgi:hypothetical protein
MSELRAWQAGSPSPRPRTTMAEEEPEPEQASPAPLAPSPRAKKGSVGPTLSELSRNDIEGRSGRDWRAKGGLSSVNRVRPPSSLGFLSPTPDFPAPFLRAPLPNVTAAQS